MLITNNENSNLHKNNFNSFKMILLNARIPDVDYQIIGNRCELYFLEPHTDDCGLDHREMNTPPDGSNEHLNTAIVKN